MYAWDHVPPVLPVLYPVSRVHTLLRSGTRDAGSPMSKGVCIFMLVPSVYLRRWRRTQIKVVTKVQVKTARVKKSYKAEERRQWRKFGDCAGLEPGEMGANVTFTTTDDVLLERKKQGSEEEKSVDMFANLCTSGCEE